MQPFISYLIVGIVFVLIGIFNIVKGSKMKSKCTEITSARIVEIERSYDTSDDDGPGGQYTYTPIFEFSANGIPLEKVLVFIATIKENTTLEMLQRLSIIRKIQTSL